MQNRQHNRARIRAGWILASLVCVTGLAQEEGQMGKTPFRRFLEQDYLLGDWGGLRTDLSKRGLDFEFLYAASLPSNLGGGLNRDTVFQGALLMMLDMNSGRLVGFEGGLLHIGSLWLHGEKPFSDRFIGDLNKVNLLDFQNGAWLWELYYEQKLLANRLSIKAGQLAIDRDFIVPEFYNSIASLSLLNQTFFYPTMAFNVYDQPYFPVGHHALASTPYGTPGVRLRFDPCSCAYVQAGLYDGNPDRNSPGTRLKLSRDEGALLYFEVGLKINQSKEAHGPRGNLKLGAYYHTDDFYDTYEGTFVAFDNFVAARGIPLPPISGGSARTHQGNYGIYLLADQVLWRELGKDDPAQQGLAGFWRVGFAPEDRNLTQWGVDGGLVYKGLIPKRDWDTLALAASYLGLSGDLRRAQGDINAIIVGAGGPAPFPKRADYEGVIELNYKAQVTAWWTVQASVQRVFHPGGRAFADIPDAWAFIVQTTLRL